MKIVLLAYGENCNCWFVSNWLKYYDESQTDVECVLFHDKTLNSEVKNVWPHKSVECSENIELSFVNPLPKTEVLRGDVLRMLAYRYIGPCLVTEYDALIKKQITKDMIPMCDFGLVQKTNLSRTIDNCGQPVPHIIFDEFSFVDECIASPQVVRKDYFDQYVHYLDKYKSQMYKLPGGYYQYFEAVLCLVHKLNNGVYLQPEWNWMYDSSIRNDNVIIEHYFSEGGKITLLNQEMSPPQILIGE
jgi:hypothetical protein